MTLAELLHAHLEEDRRHAPGADAAAAYAFRKTASEALDRALGFDLERSESRIAPGARENWAHLSPQIFQTPYSELAEIVERADPRSEVGSWVDLGAAYGRLGLVLSVLRPKATFEGLEREIPRVEEARRIFERWRLPEQVRVRAADVTSEPVPEADLFFIYDFGAREEIERTLESLRERARTRKITVVGRGRRIRDAIERGHPWLAGVVPPEHGEHSSLYRSA